MWPEMPHFDELRIHSIFKIVNNQKNVPHWRHTILEPEPDYAVNGLKRTIVKIPRQIMILTLSASCKLTSYSNAAYRWNLSSQKYLYFCARQNKMNFVVKLAFICLRWVYTYSDTRPWKMPVRISCWGAGGECRLRLECSIKSTASSVLESKRPKWTRKTATWSWRKYTQEYLSEILRQVRKWRLLLPTRPSQLTCRQVQSHVQSRARVHWSEEDLGGVGRWKEKSDNWGHKIVCFTHDGIVHCSIMCE